MFVQWLIPLFMMMLPSGGDSFMMPMRMTVYGGYRNKDCELTHLLMNRDNVELMSKHSSTLQRHTILYLSSRPCPDCDEMDKRLKNLSDSFPEVSFLKLDVRRDDYALLMYLKVSSFPYLVFYRDGERVSQHHALDPELVSNLIHKFSEK